MRPAELRRLDALLASAMIAHEVIFEMSRELREQGSIGVEAEGLLRESAQIVTVKLPDRTSTVHGSRSSGVNRASLSRLVRQRQIASRLRDLLED
jgi:hypothetical protein